MEPATATSFPVARDQRGWGRWVFLAIMSLIVTGSFALAVYQARQRHSRRDLAFVIVTYYLIVVLCFCLEKLNLLRRDHPAVASPERRRVRIALWAFSVALAVIFAARASIAMTDLGLKIALWVVTGLGIGLSFYFFLARADAGRQMDARALDRVSPEQRV